MEWSVWFKSTIPGIIILGALGSVVAIFVIRLVRFLLFKCIPGFYEWLQKYEFKMGFRDGYVVGALIGDNSILSVKKMIILLLFNLGQLIFAVFISSISIIYFIFQIQDQTKFLLSVSTYFSLVFSFVSFYWGWLRLSFIVSIYKLALNDELKASDKAYEDQ